MPSGPSRFQSSDSQCYPFKKFVDELPPLPFIQSPIVNSQRNVGWSLEYEGLLKDTKEKSPLRRRRMVRGVTYSVEKLSLKENSCLDAQLVELVRILNSESNKE